MLFDDDLNNTNVSKEFSISASDDNSQEAVVTVGPLPLGYGHTIGNALRRIMLSSMGGYAVIAISSPKAKSEFDVIPGVREDMIQIIDNLKNMIILNCTASFLDVEFQGPCEVTAKSLDDTGKLEVKDPDHHICRIGEDINVSFRIFFSKGSGFFSSEHIAQTKNFSSDVIPIDVNFSSVKRAVFSVSNSRIGNTMDYDQLEMTICTNGAITPVDAVKSSAKLLRDQLRDFVGLDEEDEESFNKKIDPSEDPDKKSEKEKNLHKPVHTIELSVRAQNCLKHERVEFIYDLVGKTEVEMLKTPNFGKKSLNELKNILKGYGFNFGMSLEGIPRPKSGSDDSDLDD